MMMPPVRRIKKAFVFEYVPAIPTRERERANGAGRQQRVSSKEEEEEKTGLPSS
jgi:hypothetical protein